MKSTLLKSLLISTFLLLSFFNHAATLFENFDNPSVAATNNNGVEITYPSGIWYTFGITKPTNATENDRIDGIYSMRMRGLDAKNSIYMKFDKAGAGTLSFNYCSYSNHSGGEFTIQKSTNGGTTWVDAGTPMIVPKWSGTFLTYSLPVNYDGNIRFKIVVSLRTPNNANEQFNIDNFQITDFGTEQTAMPISSVATGVYQTTQTLTLTSATAGATIYYSTDGTSPTTSSLVYSSAISVSTTTKIKAIAVAASKVDSRVEVVIINIPETFDNIAAYYTKMATAGTNFSYFKYTGEAIVTASYTATYKTVFLQDNTAGVLISDYNRNMVNTLNIGDKVTNIIAQVNRINDSPQLYPYTDLTVVTTGNSIVAPVVTLADIPNRTNQLVQINDLYFDEANAVKTFGPNSPYVIHDASLATTTTTFRVPSGMPNPDYINTIISAKRNVICLVAKNNTAVASHTIFARSATDLDVQISGVNKQKISNLSVIGNSIVFETQTPKTICIYSFSGQQVKNFVSSVGKNSIELAKGVYIVRIGDKTAKVLL